MRLLFGIILLAAGACSKYNIDKGKTPLSGPKYFEPGPGTVLVDSNFYADRFETTNFNWLEYMYWTQKTFGYLSEEHLTTYPDSNVWVEYGSAFENYGNEYLKHPAYRNFPVVGISQDQAQDYCNWRSNMVFELILIREGVLEWNDKQTQENYFSIKRYFTDTIFAKERHPKVKYYPKFDLPSYTEWKKFYSYFETENQKFIEDYCKSERNKPMTINSFENCPKDSTGIIPDCTWQVYTECKKKVLYSHLRGNAAEWSSEPNITFGGGWTDSLSTIMNNDKQHQDGPSVQTGMRCVMRWVEWEE